MHVRADAEAQVVRRRRGRGVDRRRLAEPDDDLGAGDRQVLPGPDVDRNPLPAPRVDFQSHGSERLDLRTGRYALLVAIAAKLTADDFGRRQWPDRLEHFHLLV